MIERDGGRLTSKQSPDLKFRLVFFTLKREGSHLIDCYTTDDVIAGFCILQIGQIGQFDVFGYIADGSAYCLRNLAQHRLILQ